MLGDYLEYIFLIFNSIFIKYSPSAFQGHFATHFTIIFEQSGLTYQIKTFDTILTKAPKSELAKSNNRNQNRQFRLFDYEVYLLINNRQKKFDPRETQEWQGPAVPSSFTHHGSISFPTLPVDNYDWAL